MTIGTTLAAEIYDPAANKWTDLGQLNLARIDVTVAPLPDGGAIVCGSTAVGEVAVELFDPKTGRFTVNK
jgi:hypothetical protein